MVAAAAALTQAAATETEAKENASTWWGWNRAKGDLGLQIREKQRAEEDANALRGALREAQTKLAAWRQTQRTLHNGDGA